MKTSKDRSDGNTLGQVSLPRTLLAKSKQHAKSKGLPWATWVRTLIIKELEASGVKHAATESEGGDDPVHFPLPARGGAGAFASRLRR